MRDKDKGNEIKSTAIGANVGIYYAEGARLF